MRVNKKNILLFLILLFFILSVGSAFYIYNSPNAILFLLEGCDKPSKQYSVFSNRLYKISNKKKLGDKLLYQLQQNKNNQVHDLYINILGIIGDEKAFDYLLNEALEQKADTPLSSKMYYIVLSMGMIGDKRFSPTLEKMLVAPDYNSFGVSKYDVARALYLITGKRYEYIGQSGKKTKITLTEELVKAREITRRPKDYNRSYNDMLLLANLDLPSEDGTRVINVRKA